MKIKSISSLKGELCVPGDKSISHRAIMLGSLADGDTKISGFLQGADCFSTIRCFKTLGINIEYQSDYLVIHGKGLYSLKKPSIPLDAGNSGTTIRLLSGILAAQPFSTILTGDTSIQKRPMKRIIEPLTFMGADIKSIAGTGCAPLSITGAPLHGISYTSPVASAQVKSALLLAGLYAQGETSVTEPYLSRNHTELMLRSFGVPVKTSGTTSAICSVDHLDACCIDIPGDISSAAYWIAAALITPNSYITIRNVGINSTRDGFIRVCRQMGAQIVMENERKNGAEPIADITVRYSPLKGVTIEGSSIPALIDEIPLLAVLACFAKGETVIRDASELKVKESNRIDGMVKHLAMMGAEIEATEDGMRIYGGKPLHGATIDSLGDHRIAMAFSIAALAAEKETVIQNAECVTISYPNFYLDLNFLSEQKAVVS